MPWYSDCPRCSEAFGPLVSAPPTTGTAATASTPPAEDANRFRLSRTRRQTLRHYLPRLVVATLSGSVFCLTGILAALDLDQQSKNLHASAPASTVRSAELTAPDQIGGP